MNEDTLAVILGVGQGVLLAALMLVIPRVTRRGLLFGVYVGEAAAQSDRARRITRRWTIEMIVTFFVILGATVPLALTVKPAIAIAASPVLLVIGFLVVYLLAHRRARPLAIDTTSSISVGTLTPRSHAQAMLALATLAIVLMMGLATIAYAAVQYASLPEKFPIHFDIAGEPDRWVATSPISVFLLPALNLIVSGMMAGAAWLIATAKRSLRREAGGVTLAAQSQFHRMFCLAFCGLALLISIIFTVGTISTIRVALGEAARLHWVTIAASIGVSALAFGVIVLIAARIGQGGGKLERAAADAPLAGALADNRHWYLGLIYVNRDDPSILIEHRFGIGYTINFGNWRAVALLVGFLALIGLIMFVSVVAL